MGPHKPNHRLSAISQGTVQSTMSDPSGSPSSPGLMFGAMDASSSNKLSATSSGSRVLKRGDSDQSGHSVAKRSSSAHSSRRSEDGQLVYITDRPVGSTQPPTASGPPLPPPSGPPTAPCYPRSQQPGPPQQETMQQQGGQGGQSDGWVPIGHPTPGQAV